MKHAITFEFICLTSPISFACDSYIAQFTLRMALKIGISIKND